MTPTDEEEELARDIYYEEFELRLDGQSEIEIKFYIQMARSLIAKGWNRRSGGGSNG